MILDNNFFFFFKKYFLINVEDPSLKRWVETLPSLPIGFEMEHDVINMVLEPMKPKRVFGPKKKFGFDPRIVNPRKHHLEGAC